MANLTLKQLRYFEALARNGHFGRAADTCAISQPAMSMQIKELEESLGAELFERGARQVRLTNLGEEFSSRVRNILRSVDELEDLARASRERLVGRLRLGVIPTVAPYLLPKTTRSSCGTSLWAVLGIFCLDFRLPLPGSRSAHWRATLTRSLPWS